MGKGLGAEHLVCLCVFIDSIDNLLCGILLYSSSYTMMYVDIPNNIYQYVGYFCCYYITILITLFILPFCCGVYIVFYML